MNIITVIRKRKYSTDVGTYGYVMFNGAQIGVTVEQPWDDNIPNHSCVPEGEYDLHPHSSPKHPNTVSLNNPSLNIYAEPNLVPSGVNGRTDCLIHSANFPSELEGCIAIGTDYFLDKNDMPIGVKNSKDAISHLSDLWGDRSNLQLSIRWDE